MSTKKQKAMTKSIVLSRDVLNTIKSLPMQQQFSILSAIAGEMIMGAVIHNELTTEEMQIYSLIKRNITRDSLGYDV